MSKSRWGRILTTIGVLLLTYWAIHNSLRYQSLTLEASQTVTQPATGENPVSIVVAEKINIDIADAVLNGKRWGVWSDKATYLPSSARIGEPSNIIIYGHNTDKIFGKLRFVKPGEEIILISAGGNKRSYIVEQSQVVNTAQIDLLLPTNYEVLTLYTCAGPLDSQRLVVRAQPNK